MTRIQVKNENWFSMDRQQIYKLIDKIYDDFEKQLEDVKKEYWIKGTNDNYKALKESGKLK